MEYLDKITTNKFSTIDTDDLNAEKTNIDIKLLISECLTIRTDVSKERIEEQRSNPYINKLIKGNRIVSCEDDFKSIRSDNNLFYNNLDTLCLFLLSDSYKGLIERLEMQSGFHHYTTSSNHENLFIDQVEPFRKDGTNKNWNFAKRFFFPHHSIVIADPFLFHKSEDGRSSINSFLDTISQRSLIRTYNITFIGSNGSYYNPRITIKKIQSWINEIKKNIFNDSNITIQYFIVDQNEFHDRYIITNNSYLNSGYGIDIIINEKQTKDGKWEALKPFKQVIFNGVNVFYVNVMKEKLLILKSWIIEQGYNEPLNPLLKNELLNPV